MVFVVIARIAADCAISMRILRGSEVLWRGESEVEDAARDMGEEHRNFRK